MTAAALIVSGAALIATANAETFKGRCFGVNGCAGKGACKTAANDCKGKNACKGKGWIEMLNTECADQGGTFERRKHQARAGRGRAPAPTWDAKEGTRLSTVKPPFLGFGLGLRPQHYAEILNGSPEVDWFEVLSENYMVEGGQPLRMLDRICERYPVVMHGVSLSIASTSPLDLDYLARLKALAARVNPKWISDHLCWTGVHGVNLHDLLPIPYTLEALDHVVDRVSQVQDFLGRRLTLENVSSYVTFGQSEMTEWEFVSEVANRADCWLLFDVNNVYVSAYNHGFSADDFLNGVPRDRVVQFHVAGHSHEESHIVDTHDHPVCDEVWDVYRAAVAHFGPVSTMIERDDNIPPLADLVDELNHARSIAREVLGAPRLAAAE